MRWYAALVIGCVIGLTNGPAADWPQWRGQKRDGISTERVAWPDAGPKVVWRALVGVGFSGISVSQGKAYTMGNAKEQEQDTIWCLDARTGTQLWKHSYPAELGPVYYEGGPGSTPTVHDGRVYTIGKWGDVFCLDAANGQVIWHQALAKHGIKSNRWGFAGSPLIWNDLVILNAAGAGTALDRRTGKLIWSNGTQPTGYASPTLMTADTEQVLIFAAKHLVAVDPKTGAERWRFPWETGWDTNNPDPLVYRRNIFISSFSRGCALLELKQGKVDAVYQNKVLHNHLSPGILLGEHLYAFNGQAGEETDFRCIHLPSGELKWNRKDPAMGSLICADGQLIILSERGELLLADASPSSLKILARWQVLNGRCWTPPSLADGLVYVRNAKGDLHCLDLKGTPSERTQ